MEQILYVVTLILFIISILCMQVWTHKSLFATRRVSIWKRQHLHLHARILTFVFLAACIYLYMYYDFYTTGVSNMYLLHLVGLFSSLTIAQSGLTVYSLSDRRRISKRVTFQHFFIPVLFLPLYLVTGSMWVLNIAWIYYVVYVLLIFRVCMQNSRQFVQRLEDAYVNLDHRQILYRYRAIYFCVFILCAWAVYLLAPSYILHSIYFVVSAIGWGYFTHMGIHLIDSPLANTMQAPAETPANVVAEPSPADILLDSPALRVLDERLDEVLKTDNLYLDPSLDVQMLAQVLCTNRTYIGRVFRMRGTTFSRYINSLRLSYAEEQLRSSLKSVGEICEECGFSDATFRRVFSDRYHCTPMEYRRTVQKT